MSVSRQRLGQSYRALDRFSGIRMATPQGWRSRRIRTARAGEVQAGHQPGATDDERLHAVVGLAGCGFLAPVPEGCPDRDSSALFRRLWGAHDVLTHGAGTKHFRHPVVGDVTVAYEELAITAEPDLVMIVYTAEPASTSQERLRVLASWAASQPEAGAGAPAADPRTTGAAQEG